MNLFRSLLTYLAVAIYVLLFAPAGMLVASIARRPSWLYRLGTAGLRFGFWIAGVKFSVEGLDRVQPGSNYVFISNHASNLDPLILILAVPRQIRAIAKKELRKFPLVGRAMDMVGFVFVDRRKREEALAGVDRSAAMLRKGHSFLVFPEGTRSKDGKLGAFKKGAFVMAIKSGVDLMPAIVQGSFELMPRGALVVKPGKVRVRFLDPISVSGLAFSDREKLLSGTREIMELALSSGQA